MSLTVDCFMCDTELDEPGAILFSPPTKTGLVRKRHLCIECSKLMDKYFKRIKQEAQWRQRELAKNA